MNAIILCGGFGTRLAPTVLGLPKVLAPIGGEPFLNYLLRYLEAQGFQKVVLSIGYGAEKIKALYSHHPFSFELSWVQETKPLGTGGALCFLSRQLEDEDYFVLNGDTLLDFSPRELLSFHQKNQADLTVIAHQVFDVSRYGQLVWDSRNQVVECKEKVEQGPGWINAGVYLLKPKQLLLLKLPEHHSFEQEILVARAQELKIYCLPVKGFFIDIGTPADYKKALTLIPNWEQRRGTHEKVHLLHND